MLLIPSTDDGALPLLVWPTPRPCGSWVILRRRALKKLTLIALSMMAMAASAQVYVKPHINKDGTFVEGHYRSRPNKTDLDNYNTRGNVNPYNGEAGSRRPSDQPYQAPGYPAPRNTYGTDCGYTASGRYVCR